MLEDGAREGDEPPLAGAAALPRDVGSGGAVSPAAASQSLWVRPIGFGGTSRQRLL